MPTTVSEAAWTWEGPEDSALLEILPVPTGAVLHMRDGAVGLDTRTGEEVWSYRLLEAEADVVVSPDGSLVAVSAGGSLTLLDSGTGEGVRMIEHGETEAGHLSLGARTWWPTKGSSRLGAAARKASWSPSPLLR